MRSKHAFAVGALSMSAIAFPQSFLPDAQFTMLGLRPPGEVSQ